MKEIRAYLKYSWRMTLSYMPFKLMLLWAFTMVDIFCLLYRPAWAQPLQPPLMNAPGVWDDIQRVLFWSIGPWDRELMKILFFFFVVDLFLGLGNAFWRGSYNSQRVFQSLVKGAVYVILMGSAWQVRKQDMMDLLPWIGLGVSRGLEAFIIGTEFISVLKNADLILEKATGKPVHVLRGIIRWLERGISKTQFDAKLQYNVMVIDDDKDVRDGLRTVLGSPALGPFRIWGFSDVQSGIEEALASRDVDVVILDLGLRDTSGFDTFMEFRTACPTIPIVVLTGSADPDVQAKCRAAGAKEFLLKGNLKRADIVRALITSIESERVVKEVGARIQDIQLGGYLLPPTGKTAEVTLAQLAKKTETPSPDPPATPENTPEVTP